jgi:hypothetical protein
MQPARVPESCWDVRRDNRSVIVRVVGALDPVDRAAETRRSRCRPWAERAWLPSGLALIDGPSTLTYTGAGA